MNDPATSKPRLQPGAEGPNPSAAGGALDQRLVRCSCGSQCFERVTPIRGAWREYVVFNDDGTENMENSESTTDGLIHWKAPKTMRCANCGKRRSNPDTPNADVEPPRERKANGTP